MPAEPEMIQSPVESQLPEILLPLPPPPPPRTGELSASAAAALVRRMDQSLLLLVCHGYSPGETRQYSDNIHLATLRSRLAFCASSFMEAAKELERWLSCLQQSDGCEEEEEEGGGLSGQKRDVTAATEEEMLRNEIANMEEELRAKASMIERLEGIVGGWRADVREQLRTHVALLNEV